MAHRFFDPGGGIWKPLGYLGDLVILSLLWAVCSIPVVTLGASTAALYDTAEHALRRKDSQLISRFISTFRRELMSGVLSTLLWAAVIFCEYLIFAALAGALSDNENRAAILLTYIVLVAFFTLCAVSWVCPTLSRFTFRTCALNATALRLAFGHILRSVVLAVLIGATLILGYLLIFPLMVTPALAALLATYLIEPVFHKYERPDGDASENKQ